ncbi:MAG: NUDIX domain-containing protein [Planctomycetales bacterium]
MDQWPQYACAILVDRLGRLLLESRPSDAPHAAGQLTCFGGRREPEETPEECLRRELQEELGWSPGTIAKRVELWVAGEPIAWFYQATLEVVLADLQVVPGREALLVARESLATLPVSPWHMAVLDAWCEGRDRVELDR